MDALIPGSPDIRRWAEQVAELVRGIELELIHAIRDSVYADMGASWYQVDQLARIATVRARVERILGRNWEQVLDRAQTVLNEARDAGQGQALRDLKNAGLSDLLPPSQAFGVEAIALDMLTGLSGIPAVILRQIPDAYQKIMAGPVSAVTTGSFTRVQATDQALRDWARNGVPGFIDRGGRNWSMDAYTEMAVRTGCMNAMREGHAFTMRQMGQDLIQVTGHGYTCPICGKYQGKVLSLGSTPPGKHLIEHATQDGVFVEVEVFATVAQATEEGLYHPQCGHSNVGFFPGLTTPYTAPPNVATYEKSQQQRALEVEVRKVKRELAASIDPDAQKALRKQKYGLQKQIRELVDENPMLARKPRREQIRTAH